MLQTPHSKQCAYCVRFYLPRNLSQRTHGSSEFMALIREDQTFEPLPQGRERSGGREGRGGGVPGFFNCMLHFIHISFQYNTHFYFFILEKSGQGVIRTRAAGVRVERLISELLLWNRSYTELLSLALKFVYQTEVTQWVTFISAKVRQYMLTPCIDSSNSTKPHSSLT